MGGEAFDGEGAGDADFGFVLVGFVVEVFEGGVAGDGGVNLFLAFLFGLPEGFEGGFGGFGPVGGGVAGDFPFEEGVVGGGFAGGELGCAGFGEVEVGVGASAAGDGAGGFVVFEVVVEGGEGFCQLGLVLRVDGVDFGVVNDGFEGYVGDALIDEAEAEIAPVLF